MTITREYCPASAETFSIPAVAALLDRWLLGGQVIVDAFARNSRRGTLTNDLNPETEADFHLPADKFAEHLLAQGKVADVILFDPPYSPRQISECYQNVGLPVTSKDTQNASLYASVRDPLARVLRVGGIAISFGWNSTGFGRGRGFVIEEILMVCHGAAHNDTICVVERKAQAGLFDNQEAA